MGRKRSALTVVLILAIGAAGWSAWKWWPRAERTATVEWLNTRPEVHYVGDGACAECHKEVAERYRQHPMGRSLVPVKDELARGRAEHAKFDSGGFSYVVERDANQTIHSERLLDSAGKPIVTSSGEARFVIGSGQQGQSYVIDRSGYLFMSPITWYRSSGWGLSPGYSEGSLHFDRPVTAACLDCHSNRPLHVEGSENRYREPIFDGYAIGCERCHGPGELHVARQKSGRSPGADNTIVNPARLGPTARDAVCEQCHLQGESRIIRRGRSLNEYRPGLPLHDYVAIFVRPPELTKGRRAINHVEQLEVSRCREASSGRLGCIVCHDPHGEPAANQRVAYFRERCLNCHHDAGCRVPDAVRLQQSPDDSCIDCHMPRTQSANIAHMAVTDHRIVRRPGDDPPVPDRLRPSGEFPMIHFHGHLPGAQGEDHRRNLGLMAAEMATRPGPEPLRRMIAGRAEPLLRQAVSDAPDDADAQEALGTVLLLQGRPANALAAFDVALTLSPGRASALEGAALAATDLGDARAAEDRWERYIAAAPFRPRGHYRLAEVRASRSDWPGVLSACRESLRLDPTAPGARNLLARALRESGDPAAAVREQSIMRAIEKSSGSKSASGEDRRKP